MPTDTSDLVQLTFYAKIFYDLLQFIHRDTAYAARYELTLAIKNATGESLPGRINKGEISVTSYAETNSRSRFALEKLDFVLPSGEYTFFIELLDVETKQPLQRNEKIVLPVFFSESFTTSKIFFVDLRDQGDTTKDAAYPVFPTVFPSSNDSIYARFFVCSNELGKRIKLKKTIFSSDNRPIHLDTLTITLNSRIQPVEFPLLEKLKFGQYALSISLSDSKTNVVIKSPFYIQWKSHTTMIPNLQQAIETIQYVMEKNQWNDLMKQSPDIQQTTLGEFWDERDPDPSTQENELEEEYYRRVNFSNRHFSSWNDGTDGWRTDRGKIYIICGPPSDVESPSTATSQKSQYEIWYYRNLQKRFVFLDRYGNGDFRLISEE
jgi:GWxTD domain-containing protein